MKQERFEKVVKWEEKPIFEFLFMGVLNIISAILLFILTLLIYDYGEIYILSTIGTSVCIVTAFLCFAFGAGSGKKVYWRKIK